VQLFAHARQCAAVFEWIMVKGRVMDVLCDNVHFAPVLDALLHHGIHRLAHAHITQHAQ
jgi:hypothetical protein